MMQGMRVVTIGQYINSGSVIHRLDPRVKIVALVTLIVTIFFCSTFTALAALAMACVFVLALARISPHILFRSLGIALVFLLYFYLFQVLFYQPTTPHPHVYWRWWILSVSREGLVFSAIVNSRVLILFFFVSLMLFTTTVVDLTDAVESLLSPLQRIGVPVQETTMVLVVALKFVPIFFAELGRLIKARAARGVAIDTGNVIQRFLNLAPVLIPLILGGLRRAEALAVAMEARGYHGGRGRTKLRQLRYGARDVVAALFLGVVVIGTLYINLHAAL